MIFQASFANLETISNVIGQAAQAAGLDDGAVYEVQLAVDEACSNIIRHAYGGEGRGEIHISTRITGDGLTVILRDFGAPFDPDTVPVPEIDKKPIEELEIEGLGLFWMHKLVDEVRFEFDQDKGNRLTLFKRKPAAHQNTGQGS